MSEYTLHRGGGDCGVALTGDTLRDVISHYAHRMAEQARLGTAAGYRLNRISVHRPPDSESSPRMIRVEITAQGLPIVAGAATAPRTASVYLRGPLPTAEECAELVWEWPPLTPETPEEYYHIMHPSHPRHIAL